MASWAQLFLDNDFSIPIAQDQFSILCPFHDDNVQSCAINLVKGVWICFAGCGQGSLYGFFMKYLHLGYEEIKHIITQDITQFDVNMFDELLEVPEEMQEVNFPFHTGYVPPWIFDRGFSKEALLKWGGAIDNFGSLVLPVRTIDGILIGWLSRRQNVTPKYLYSKVYRNQKFCLGKI